VNRENREKTKYREMRAEKTESKIIESGDERPETAREQ
jgi:hypothetical protein